MRSVLRSPAVAGTFYPKNAQVLSETIRRCLDSARLRVPPGSVPKAIIVPHAGYLYSGQVAASAYARVALGRGCIERAVVLGPAHTVALECIAASGADGFSTPLGVLDVDVRSRDELIGEGLVAVSDRAHAAEHSLEVQLPFLQVVLGCISVLPLLVGAVPVSEVVQVLDRVWDGPATLVVLSTDLSHYHDRDTAEHLDARTASAVVALRPEEVGPGDACGVFPLRGLLAGAAERAMDVELLELRTSADSVGDPSCVVGYGAFALS